MSGARYTVNRWMLREEDGGRRLVAEGYSNLPRNPKTGEREIEVLPADAPNVLTVDEARAIGEICAGDATPEQEQLGLNALGRLDRFAKEAATQLPDESRLQPGQGQRSPAAGIGAADNLGGARRCALHSPEE